MLISIAMIVKNEEAVLERCLSSLKDLADEIVLVDTGSTDKTVSIGSQFTSNIYKFDWINDFSAARNFAISKCNGKFVMIIDADEYIDELQKEFYRKWFENEENSENESYVVKINNFSEKLELVTHQTIRIIKNNSKSKFVGKIHEQIVSINHCESPIEIYHTGYFSSVIDKKNKVDRNYKMLINELKEKPNALNYYYLAKEYLRKNDLEKAKYYLIKALGNRDVYEQMWVHYGFVTLLELLDFKNETSELRDISSDLVSEFPTKPEYYYYYAKAMIEEGELLLAKSLFEATIALVSEAILDKVSLFENSLKALWKIYYLIGEKELAYKTLTTLIKNQPQKDIYVKVLINLLTINKNDISKYIFEFYNSHDHVKENVLRTLGFHDCIDDAILLIFKMNKTGLYESLNGFLKFIKNGQVMNEDNLLKKQNDSVISYYIQNQKTYNVTDSATFTELIPFMNIIKIDIGEFQLQFDEYLNILLCYSLNLDGFLDRKSKGSPLDMLLAEIINSEIEELKNDF